MAAFDSDAFDTDAFDSSAFDFTSTATAPADPSGNFADPVGLWWWLAIVVTLALSPTRIL